jgi:succinyl-diaminopimelate desuccinylase
MSATLQLCRDLVERASLTPRDAGCQALLCDRLAAIGFKCTDLPYGEVSNFWAERGDEGPILVFAGHTDVVPTGPVEAWDSPPFVATLKDGVLYGRGVADMKGSLAAMIVACERFVAEQPQHAGRIGFLITSDEEGPAADGTVRVMDWLQAQGKHIDWCLVGEPSSSEKLGDVIKNGRRGSLGGTLTVHGTQGHIAYPHLADNPIHRAMPALAALCSEIWDTGNASFPPTSFQVSNIHSGTGASNVIPGAMTAQFNFRFSTELTVSDIQQRTTAILDAHSLEYSLDWQISGLPFLTQSGELVAATVASIRDCLQREPELSTAGGTSDGRFIAPTGTQVVELGPVNATIHKLNEAVSAADLDHLTDVYQRLLHRLLVPAS